MLSAVMMLIYCVFFFFKQKTAYEMRISDWSSDVCSSDLPGARLDHRAVLDEQQGRKTAYAEALQQAGILVGIDGRDHDLRGNLVGELAEQIGRASCRERVCQYV